MIYDKLIWTSLKNLKERVLLVPLGSIEQHGLRLPLGVDSFLAEAFCNQINDKIESIVAPVISYGARSLPNSGGGDSFPGTISIRGTTLIEYYEDIVCGYLKAGFKTIIIVNAHWENEPFFLEAIERLKEQNQLGERKVLFFSWWSVLEEWVVREILPEFAGWKFEHAGRAEMALMLHYYPDFVINNTEHKSVDLNINSDLYTYPINEKIRENYGSLSSCENISKEMGERLANYTERSMLNVIEEFLNDGDK